MGGHTVQYALVGNSSQVVLHTEGLSDAEVRARAWPGPAPPGYVVERFNRCPVCEVWTTYGGKLRPDCGCPAVAEALAALAARETEG